MGFVLVPAKPAAVPFHPVVYRLPIAPALDPLTVVLFIAALVATALLTIRRPAYAAMLLIAIPPFTYEHAVFGTTFSFPKMVLLGAIAGMLVHRSSLHVLRSLRTSMLAFASIVLAIALTSFGALYHAEVAREAFKWIEYALFYATAAAAYGVDPDAKIVRRGFAIAVLVVCASAFADLYIGAASGLWIGNVSIPRIAGFLEGPNQLAGYLEVSIAFLAAWSIDAPRRSTAIVLAIAACALILTLSRAAAVGVLAIVVVTIALRGRQMIRPLLAALAGVVAGAAGVIGLLLSVKSSSSAAQNVLFRASDTTGAGAGGVGSRRELWRAAWYFFRHHPLLGVGAGNYELRLSEAGLHGVRTHANSWYLQALAEGGIVLFAATLFFIVVMALQSLANARRSAWALAAFAATIALALHQVADYLVFYPKVAEPWIVLCALAAIRPAQTCD